MTKINNATISPSIVYSEDQYTCRRHTDYISQKYNRETIEYYLDSFTSSDNDRCKGFPLIIEIKQKVELFEVARHHLLDDNESRVYSFTTQLADEEDYSIITDPICQNKNEDIISHKSKVMNKAVVLGGLRDHLADDNISRVYSFATQQNGENTILEVNSMVTDPFHQIENEDISHKNEFIHKEHSACQIEDSISHKVSDRHQCSVGIRNMIQQLRKRLHKSKIELRSVRNKSEQCKKEKRAVLLHKASLFYDCTDNKSSEENKENSTFIRKIDPICQIDDKRNISHDNELINIFDPIYQIEGSNKKFMSKFESILTSSTRLSFDDDVIIDHMRGNVDGDTLSDSGRRTNNKELEDHLSIDDSTVDLSFQQRNVMLDDQSYSVSNSSEIYMNSYKHIYQGSQVSVALTQSSTFTTDNTHIMELKARKRLIERAVQNEI